MTEYRLANGDVLTDEDIEREAKEYESGEWLGSLTSLKVGRPSLAEGQRTLSMSFRCPEAGAALIEEAAALSGKKKSTFVREAAIEKAISILGRAS